MATRLARGVDRRVGTRIGRPFSVAPPPATARNTSPRHGLDHDAGDDRAVDLGGDRDAEARVAVEEVHGAVDGVDQPAHPGAAPAAAALLAEDRVGGPGLQQPADDQPLDGLVDVGHHVGGGRLGGGHLPRPLEPPADLAGRLSGDRLAERGQTRREPRLGRTAARRDERGGAGARRGASAPGVGTGGTLPEAPSAGAGRGAGRVASDGRRVAP